jgi:hypothetical protein
MPVTVSGTSITFNDATVQSTAASPTTTATVLSATAGATAGAVGTYVFAWRAGWLGFGSTVAGSTIYSIGTGSVNSCGNTIFAGPVLVGAALTGTWRIMGSHPNNGSTNGFASVYLRVS